MAGKQARKSGGAVAAKATGGAVASPAPRKDGGKACDMPSGKMAKRARGGRTGADTSPMAPGSARHPYSSAHRK